MNTKFDQYNIPEHIRQSIELYIKKGIAPGSFLTAVICNDLKGAFMTADFINIRNLHNIVGYFYWEVPMTAWGSRETMEYWLRTKAGSLEDE